MALKKEEEKIKDAVTGEKEPKISDLPGIGPAATEKLEAAGIYDLMSVATKTPKELEELAGIGESVARKAIQAARSMLKLGFVDGLEFAEKRANIINITTGSKNLDELLGGKGVEGRAITEAYGAYGSGKCISKDTEVCYFNDTRMHVECIEKTYDRYKEKSKEQKFEEGQIVPVSTVKVLAWIDDKLKIVNATHLYKEKLKELFLIKTKRGRILKITGKHQLLSFDNGVKWKKAELMEKGDLIACPNKIDLETERSYGEDDAYFLGLFAAEGTHNPFSLTISEEKIKNWVCDYILRKFDYQPTVRIDKRGGIPKYIILFRNATRVIMDSLDKCNSSTKFVPEAIFLSNKNVILSFLGGYFDGDAEVSKHVISVTTKSSRLASQLTYLLLRLGISPSISERAAGIKKEKFKVVRICGEDRAKLNEIKFKLKTFDCKMRNSSYGYPKKIISFIGELYKESMGGNRGKLRKLVGKSNTQRTIYSNLIGNYNANAINTRTLDKIEETFIAQEDIFVELIKKLENEKFSINLLKEVYPKLPFAFNKLSGQIGVNKKTMQNYYSRKIPANKSELLGNLILNELKARVDMLYLALEVINEIRVFSWDIVENIEKIRYDDYVYDFVVPEGHSFVGGNMPTMMHNTQLGLSLAVNVQLPAEKGGGNGKCVFIDTEGTFRPARIKQIAEKIGANPEKVLKNIFVARAFNSDHQILLLDKVSELIRNGEPIKLMIIDSLTAHFRAEYAGRGTLADRQHKLNKYIHDLMKLAETYNLAVYVTNQVMANPAQMFGDPTVAVGGNIVGHACLTGDALIQLADGRIKEIKEINKDKVLAADFSDMKNKNADSEQMFINKGVRKIYNIKTNCQINCSELHRFFGIENFSVTEKEAKDLKEGDFIAQAKQIEIEGEDIRVPEFKIRKIGKLDRENSEIVKDKFKKDNTTRKEICKNIGITPRQLRRVLNQEWPTSLKVLDNLQEYTGRQVLQIMPVVSYKHRDLQIPEFFTPAFAQIFGYFIGDGNLEKGGLRFRDARYEVLECYNHLFKQSFNLAGKISKIKGKNCYSLSINSREISDLFVLILPEIYDYIGKSKKETVKAFIRGFVDAEGHINKKRAYISVSQKNDKILRYLQLFMLRLGIRSTIKFGIGRKKINVLRIIDKDIKDYLQIGFTSSDKQKTFLEKAAQLDQTYSYEMMPIQRKELRELLELCGLEYSKTLRPRPESYTWANRAELGDAFKAMMNCNITDRQIKQKINFIGKLLSGEIKFEKIREITINSNDNPLYDFSVPLRENYIANGFIVHNSTYRLYLRRGKQGSRVAKMIDSPNLPENETIFYLTDAGVVDEV